MKITVFGASGKCGTHFVRLAAARGHQVTAVVRATTPYDPPAGVKLLSGDVLDSDFVLSTLDDCERVFSGLGMRYAHPFSKIDSPLDFTSRATVHIVASMKRMGQKKLTLISAGGAGESYAGLNMAMRVMLRVSNLRSAYQDIERAEAVLRDSGLDWQAVRPTTLTDKPASGQVRVVERYPMTATIPREDVAAFMLKEIEADAFLAQTPMITVT